MKVLFAFAALLAAPAAAFQFAGHLHSAKAIRTALRMDYLSSLNGAGTVTPTAPSSSAMLASDMPFAAPATAMLGPAVPTTDPSENVIAISHAPLSYFAIDKLTPKGPRNNADVGQPHDATRPLAKVGSISAGSWWCAEGGWPSLARRTTTEVFYVFTGHGCLTDLDNTRHFFGPGDTVILPKGWSGRWDVLQDIHKVWFVHDHPDVEDTSNPIRARITHYSDLAPAIDGSTGTGVRTLYDLGPTEVISWACTPSSFPATNRAANECFHVLEGVFFLSNADGSAQRCVAGDTVVVPKGWNGHWDVIETVLALREVV